MLLGAHESVAGGLAACFPRAAMDEAKAVQIFTKSSGMWREPYLSPAEVAAFHAARSAAGSPRTMAHASYLINLAASGEELLGRSKDALFAEVQRSSALGIDFVVLHVGAHMGAGDDEGIRRVIVSLDEVLDRTQGASAKILIENTAGQGSVIGHRFEHLAAIFSGVHDPDRLGVCFDTQHAFAAGYDGRTAQGYEDLWKAFDATVGLPKLQAFHLNDSMKPLGSRLDRHEHIGAGLLGLPFFWRLVNDPRFAEIPAVLETEPNDEGPPHLDEVKRLAALVGGAEPVVAEKPFTLEIVEAPRSKRGRPR